VQNRVSVIIPNYNHAAFLVNRIESVLKQTFKPFEVIILDDCSTDNSMVIINKYVEVPDLYIFKNDKNSGFTFDQWKKGISKAKGELIWIAESDDYANVELLEKLITPIIDDPNVVISYCNHYTIDVNDNLVDNVHFESSNFDTSLFFNNFILDGDYFIENYLIQKNVIPNASGVLFKKEVFMKLSETPSSVSKMGDWLIWLKMLSYGKIAFNKEKLNYFRNYNEEVYKKTKSNSLTVAIYGYEMRIIYAKFLNKKKTTSNRTCEINNMYISLDIGNMGLYEIQHHNVFSGLKKILITTFWPKFKSYFIKRAVQIIFNGTKNS